MWLAEAGDQEGLAALQRREDEAAGPLALDEDEEAVCSLFAILQTQWRRVNGLPVGLDYTAVPAAAASSASSTRVWSPRTRAANSLGAWALPPNSWLHTTTGRPSWPALRKRHRQSDGTELRVVRIDWR